MSNKFKTHLFHFKLRLPAFNLTAGLMILIILGFIIAIPILAIVKEKNEEKYSSALQNVQLSVGKAFKRISDNNEIFDNITTENYIKNILSKYIKINKICDNAQDCGFPQKIKRPDGSVIAKIPKKMTEITMPVVVTNEKYDDWEYSESSTTNKTTQNYNNAHFFITQDGFHIMFFYNPYCVYDAMEKPYFWRDITAKFKNQVQLALDTACYWGVYDMNGANGPNQVGKDIGFVGSFYRGENTKAVSVLPHTSKEKPTSILDGGNNYFLRANNYCNKLDGENYRLPDINELSLMYLNREFIIGNQFDKFLWAGTYFPDFDFVSYVYFTSGERNFGFPKHTINYVSCIRKYTEN